MKKIFLYSLYLKNSFYLGTQVIIKVYFYRLTIHIIILASCIQLSVLQHQDNQEKKHIKFRLTEIFGRDFVLLVVDSVISKLKFCEANWF